MHVAQALGAVQGDADGPTERGGPGRVSVQDLEEVTQRAAWQELGDDHVGQLPGAGPQKLHRMGVVDLLQHVALCPASGEALSAAGRGGCEESGGVGGRGGGVIVQGCEGMKRTRLCRVLQGTLEGGRGGADSDTEGRTCYDLCKDTNASSGQDSTSVGSAKLGCTILTTQYLQGCHSWYGMRVFHADRGHAS